MHRMLRDKRTYCFALVGLISSVNSNCLLESSISICLSIRAASKKSFDSAIEANSF